MISVASALRRWFEGLTTSCIIINTLLMAIVWDGMPDSLSKGLDYVNYALTIYFFVEMIIKLLGLGFRQYAHDRMNVFDAFVVLASISEMVVDLTPSLQSNVGGALSAFRTFR
jgi:hypothetical protein